MIDDDAHGHADEHDDGHGGGHGAADDGPVTAGALLRQALVSDDDPRFPRWLPLPGIALALGWAAFTAATADANFLHAAAWPGAGIFALTTAATWLGWQLEID